MTTTPDAADTVLLRHTEDLLALIPHQVGHTPRNTSVLFFPVPGGSALCLSMDTPDASTDGRAMVEELTDVLGRIRHRGEVVVVVYSDSAGGDHGAVESSVHAARWAGVLEGLGLDALRILVVGPSHWWDRDEPERALPVRLIRDSAVNAQLVAAGSAEEPGALRDAPGYGKRLERRGAQLRGDWLRHSNTTGSGPTAGNDGRGRLPDPTTAGSSGRPTLTEARAGLECWHRTVCEVSRRRSDWVDVVLACSDNHLLALLTALNDGPTRDALLYSWLTGSPDRAALALDGLHAAVARLRVPAHVAAPPEPDEEVLQEALRCLAAVSGEWDGPPHWETLESAHRVLQVLDGLLWAGATGPASTIPMASASPRPVGVGETTGRRPAAPGVEPLPAVVAVLAHLEFYRGRSRTAVRLLSGLGHRSDGATPGRCAVSDVAHRMSSMAAPWWCADPRTAWPGRHWWSPRSLPERLPGGWEQIRATRGWCE